MFSEGKVYFGYTQLVTQWCLKQSDWFAFNTTIKLIMRWWNSGSVQFWGTFIQILLTIKRRMRSTTRRAHHGWTRSRQVWTNYWHGKNLARVTRLQTLLVLNVLKMLEVTSLEKISTVKKWTRMQNKQCNGVCPFNSSDFSQKRTKQSRIVLRW